jgi:type IV pilus assembly protein PilA
MKSMQKGFTLIELMIVVAIIAILAAIAIPAYQDYLIRSQVTEGASLADAAQTAVAEYYSNHGTFPTGNGGAGIATPKSIQGKYVATVTVVAATGQVEAAFSDAAPQVANSNINGKILSFSPQTAGGSIVWHCANDGVNPTSVPDKYLPASCRGAGQ